MDRRRRTATKNPDKAPQTGVVLPLSEAVSVSEVRGQFLKAPNAKATWVKWPCGLIAVLVLSEAVLACLAVASFAEARARNRSFRCRDLLFDYELPSTSTISRGARCSI